MGYNEDEEMGGNFKINTVDDDELSEPLELPDEMPDFGIDEEEE